MTKLLVLYVDLDDDLGSCNIETPIIGYENVARAALKFALCKPRDTDINALFRALQIYNDLKSAGRDVEIAAVAGCQSADYRALLTLANQLENLKEIISGRDTIVVLDSIEDERALPTISKYTNVIGVEVVVVEQARGIQSMYTTLTKIARKVLSEERYARLVLGYPGFALLVLSILTLFNLIREALIAVMIMLSLMMIVWGFGLHVKLRTLPLHPLRLAMYICVAVMIATSFYLMYCDVVSSKQILTIALAQAVSKYLHLTLIAIAIPITAKIVQLIYLKKPERALLYITLLVDIMLSYILIQNLTTIIQGDRSAIPFAITNMITVALAIMMLTTISEAIKTRG